VNDPYRFPLLVLTLSFVTMGLAAWMGAFLQKKRPFTEESMRQDLDLVVTATLTLLGLIIGFTFSMAISRFDQRKIYEEAEANGIGTEYVRADLLPAASAGKVKALLRNYVNQRILFYEVRDENELQQISSRTAQLQTELWSAVYVPASAQPTPMLALVVSGMNDVLNSQGYTQAAWWNRIPIAAWGLMISIAICSNFLVGYDRRGVKAGILQLLVLPLILAVAFFMIADIDSPRWGVIRVLPHNLLSLSPCVDSNPATGTPRWLVPWLGIERSMIILNANSQKG
jgi:hypothetical protein